MSFGKLEDKATWRVDYAEPPSAEQKAQVDKLIAEYKALTVDEVAEQQRSRMFLPNDRLAGGAPFRRAGV